MGFLSSFKDNRTEFLIAFILLFNLSLTNEFSKPFFPSFITTASFNFVMLTLGIVVNLSSKLQSNSQKKETDETIKRIDDKLGSFHEIELMRRKRLNQVKPLIDLINNNLISIKAIEETIKSKKFITFFCYQEGFKRSLPKYMKDKNKQSPRRLYPKVLEQLGFLKLGKVNHGYFIISEESLYPSELRDVDMLSTYLVKKIKRSLDEEWEEILEDAKTNDPEYYATNLNETNPLNFNFLVSKVNAKDMVHEFLLCNDFDERFNSELATLAQVRKIFVNESDKIKIKSFILGSSIKILIDDCPEHVKTALIKLEPSFRKIGVKHIYDYHKVNKNDLLKILSTTTFNQKAVTYLATLIMLRSQAYEQTLLDLGIHLE